MTLRKFLLLPFAATALLFLYFSNEVWLSLQVVGRTVHLTGEFAAIVSAAVLLQLIGHWVRAYKMSYLLAPAKASTPRFQFRALSVGYLFNTLLPFRLGELIRAQVIAGGEKMSYGFALMLIVIERALDAVILGVLGLLFVWRGGAANVKSYLVFLLLLGIVTLSLVIVIARQNQSLLRSWHRITSLFNESIQNTLRFKAWSIIYGLQRIISRKRILPYLGLTVLSWMLYFTSAYMLASYFLNNFSYGPLLSLSSYYALAIPAGPANLGVYSDIANSISSVVPLSVDVRLTYNLVSWALLIVPISLLGAIFLFTKTKEAIWRSLPRESTRRALSDKLLRTEDISQDMASFLDNYFSGNNLSRIVHELELRRDFRLMKYFKGGSDAITILAIQNKQVVVKKIIPLDLQDRLQAQYNWLQKRRKNKGIVTALREQKEATFYAIDLEYDEDNEMFFDFMHRSGLEESQKIIRTVWRQLHKSLYTKTETVTDYEAIQRYINTHIFGCMDKAATVSNELVIVAKQPKIKINGKTYHNLYQVMQKIMNNKQAMRDLATYARSDEVHGDVAVDNILVSRSTRKPLLIDPAPDGNIINGPVFDFGKNMQSLYCGYEFIFRAEEAVGLGNDGKSINYHDQRSTRYMQLCDYVRDELAPKYLSEGEQKAMLFHAGALHVRRLKHQVYQCPANVLAVYAIGIKTLNDFLAQYD